MGLITLDGFVSFSICLIGVVQCNFELIDVRFQLLLDTESLSLGTRFSFQGSLHRVHGALVIFAGVVKLFFLLMDLSVNLLSDLSKLKLCSKNLVLFLFKRGFSLFKSSLKFLFNFEATTLFVELVNGSSSISQLVKKILDLISKILVFSLYNI